MVVGAIPSVGAHANIKQIGIFLKYFEKLVAKEIQTDIDFVTRKDEEFALFTVSYIHKACV